MDLMEQIRLDSEKAEDGVCMALWDAGFCGEISAERGEVMLAAKKIARDRFQAGAQALLNLLGRSATSEGHPPRGFAWSEGPEFITLIKVPECEDRKRLEYLSRKEHEALRAADLLEVERLKGIISKAGICEENYE